MSWVEPNETKAQVKKAGKILAKERGLLSDQLRARSVVDHFRSAHSFPLNTIQMNIRTAAQKVTNESTVAQRIKRMPSIVKKLVLKPNLGLETMQDLGGCRVILPTMEDLTELASRIRGAKWSSRVIREDDYVFGSPRTTGYRSIHFVFSYQGTSSDAWDGLKLRHKRELGFSTPGQPQLRPWTCSRDRP